jgi:hypothetical protein
VCPRPVGRAIDVGAMDLDPLSPHDTERIRSRNDRVVRASLAAYLLLLGVLALSNGIRLTPDVLLVGFALVTALIGWRLAGAGGLRPIRDWLPIVLLGLAYELIRGFGPVLLRNVNVDLGAAVDEVILNGAIASDVLQRALRPASGLDMVALAATAVYTLHPLLPVMVGSFLWIRHRRQFYDFMAALVILSIAAFATYLLLPVAPPWWAAAFGHLQPAAGHSLPGHLQGPALDGLIGAAGLAGSWLTSFAFGSVSPDPVAAFPSLHAAYPVLAYLVLRGIRGPGRWIMLAWTVAAWFSIVYLGDHYLVDIAGGLVYAAVAWRIAVRSRPVPATVRSS